MTDSNRFNTQEQRRLAEFLDEIKIPFSYSKREGIFSLRGYHIKQASQSLIQNEFSFVHRSPCIILEDNGFLHFENEVTSQDENDSKEIQNLNPVYIGYCKKCDKFFIQKEKGMNCPRCNDEKMKYLSNNGRIPNWYGHDVIPLINDIEIEERLSKFSEELDNYYEIKNVFDHLRGTPKICKVTEEKLNQLDELEKKYPNMAEVLQELKSDFSVALASNSKAISFKPIVLVGSPGCGKSAFVAELCKILMEKTPLKIDLGNDISIGTLTGFDSCYKSSKQGVIIESMFSTNNNPPLRNPIIHFDELDKVTKSRDHVETVFYSLLEKSTSQRFFDNFIAMNVDASGINYIFTANTLEGIPAAIVNRLMVFKIEDYTKEQLINILDYFYESWISINDMNTEYLPERLSLEIKEKILEISGNIPRNIHPAINKVYKSTARRDEKSKHMIALFSAKQIYEGWEKFRGRKNISQTPWRLPEGFKKNKESFNPIDYLESKES